MTTLQILLVAVAVVCIAAAVGAFAIAARRGSKDAQQAWRRTVSRETVAADRADRPLALVTAGRHRWRSPRRRRPPRAGAGRAATGRGGAAPVVEEERLEEVSPEEMGSHDGSSSTGR